MAPGISDFLRRLTGSGGGAGAQRDNPDEIVEYQGYEIRPQPRQEGGAWLVAGTIRKQTEEGTQDHYFLRADSNASRESTVELTIIKAKQMIDIEGDRIFKKQSDRRPN